MSIRADLEPAILAFLPFYDLPHVVTARFVRARRLHDLLATLPPQRLRWPSGETALRRGLARCLPDAVVMALLTVDYTAAVPAKRRIQL